MFEDIPAAFVLMALVMVAALAWGGHAIHGLDDGAAIGDGEAD